MPSIEKPEIQAAREAVALLGGPVRAAELLGFGKKKYQVIQSWMRNGVPTEHCAAVERAVAGRVTRREFKPDTYARIWPELANSEFKETANA